MEAGDEIEQVAVGPERLTVADIDALLYLPNKPRARLERDSQPESRGLQSPPLSRSHSIAQNPKVARGLRAMSRQRIVAAHDQEFKEMPGLQVRCAPVSVDTAARTIS